MPRDQIMKEIGRQTRIGWLWCRIVQITCEGQVIVKLSYLQEMKALSLLTINA